jgi:hypothetical protein
MEREGEATQRLGVQRAAGSITLLDQEHVFATSGCQNRPDPGAPLQRLVSRTHGCMSMALLHQKAENDWYSGMPKPCL